MGPKIILFMIAASLLGACRAPATLTPTPVPVATDTPFPTDTPPTYTPLPTDTLSPTQPKPVTPLPPLATLTVSAVAPSHFQLAGEISGLPANSTYLIAPNWRYAAVLSSQTVKGQPATVVDIWDTRAMLAQPSQWTQVVKAQPVITAKNTVFVGAILAEGGAHLAVGAYCANCQDPMKTSLWDLSGIGDEGVLPRVDLGGTPIEFITRGGMLRGMAVSFNRHTLGVVDYDGVKLFNLSSMQMTAFPAPSSYVLNFSPDGQFVGVGTSDPQVGNVVKILDVTTGKFKQTLSGYKNRVSAVSYSPDGRLLAAGDENEILMHDVQTGQLKFTLAHLGTIRKLDFSPNGGLLASLSTAGSGVLFDTATGKELARLSAAGGTLSFSPDGRFLLLGTKTGVQIWTVQ